MGRKTLRDARVKELEKRRYPTKHYSYVLEVSWSEGSSTVIYRRYSDFFEFQCELLERFPEEAGAQDPANRMIPFLPGKKLLGRSQTRAVAEKRKEKIDDYCRALIRLPPKISDDQFVIDFFEVRPEDINTPSKPQKAAKAKVAEISEPMVLDRYVAIADYDKQKKNECSLTAGQTVEVVDKNQNGWWFVNLDDFHEGWVPATYLDPLYGSEEMTIQRLDPGEEELHITANQYSPQNSDELGFEKGVIVEVFEKGLDGWWMIRYQGQEGMAPAAYLQRYHGQASEAVLGAEVVSSVKEAVSSTIAGSASPSLSSRQQTTFKAPPASFTPKQQPGSVSSSTAVSSPPAVAAVAAATATLSSTAESKQRSQPSWHAQAHPYIDKEPIYAPTPRRHSVKRKPLRKRVPPPITDKQRATDPPTSPSYSTPRSVNMADDHPEPVYDVITDPVEELYVTVADFTAAHAGDGLSFQTGCTCSVVTKNANGWWYVDMDGSEGWVPSSYLEKRSSPTSPIRISNSATTPTSPPALPMRTRSIGSGDKKKPVSVPTKAKVPISSPHPQDVANESKPIALPPRTRSIGSGDKKKPVSVPPKAKVSISSPHPQDVANESKPVVPLKTTKTFAGFNSAAERRSSLKRSASEDSIDKEKPEKPVLPRIHSPPIQPVTRKPVKDRPRQPSEVFKKSPRPPRRSLEGNDSQPKPVPRKATMSKSWEEQPPKLVPRVHQKSASSEMLLSNNTTRSVPFGSKSPRRNSGGDSSASGKHKEELGRILQHKPMTVAPPTTNKRAPPPSHERAKLTLSSPASRTSPSLRTPINRPVPTPKSPKVTPKVIHVGGRQTATMAVKPGGSSRPYVPSRAAAQTLGPRHSAGSISVKTAPVKKGPPKRPDPPKVTSVKKQPPQRPVASPAATKRASYVTISDYAGSTDGCISFADGVSVEVLEKNDDGWWFVKIGSREGWAPSTFIEEKGPAKPARPKPPAPTTTLVRSTSPTETPTPSSTTASSGPIPKPRARPRTSTSNNFVRAVADYDVPIYDDSGIPVMRGRLYEIQEKSDTGWWFVKDGDNEGWVPAAYFKPV